MAALLRGLKAYSDEITAVVTVTDNGGSSGRLRYDFDMVAPGDIRNCLMALADCDPLLARALQYRFEEAEFKDHCFGNLLITVFSRLLGNFGDAIRELNRILKVRGRVIPATSTKVSLVAAHPDGTKSTGEVEISRSGKRIQRVELRPQPVELSPDIREAVQGADLFIFGPGSLYTSVLPNLLIDGLVEQINASGKPRVYICNLMTQPGETDAFALSDHIRALRLHVGDDFPDAVIAHNGRIPDRVLSKYRRFGAEAVRCDLDEHVEFGDVRVISEDFFAEGIGRAAGLTASEVAVAGSAPLKKGTARHDSDALAQVIADAFLRPLGFEVPAASLAPSGSSPPPFVAETTREC